MTFHGRPYDHHHFEQAHESPLVMIIPLGFLAVGSILSGFPFHGLFVGHGVKEFFGDSLRFAQGSDILEDLHHVP